MAGKSNIEWTGHTWNPIAGCSVKSPGCKHCYAMPMAARLEAMGQALYAGLTTPSNAGPVFNGTVRQAGEHVLLAPLKRKVSTVYFVNSMSDLFHENVPDEWIDRIFAVMALCPQHTFQVLTKRAARMRDYIGTENRSHTIGDEMLRLADIRTGFKCVWWPFPNVWLGVSTERQQEADERIRPLLDTPAAVRFISAEPLLGPINLNRLCILPQKPGSVRAGIHINALQGRYCESGVAYTGDWDINGPSPPVSERRKLDWVIVGGESGPDARPMHPDWARSLRDQCRDAGVKHFFKQWGRWSPTHPDYPRVVPHAVANDGTVYFSPDIAYPDGPRYGEALRAGHDKAHLTSMYPVGKAKAGRLLDGIEYNDMPTVPA